MELVYELCYCRIDIRHYVELFHVNRLRQLYLRMMGLTYSSQVELVNDLREKDEDFVDSALEVRHNICSSTYKKHSVCFIVC